MCKDKLPGTPKKALPGPNKQDAKYSCVPACVREGIQEITGTNLSEKAVRGQIDKSDGNPSHDWNTTGEDPKNTIPVLNNNGVNATAISPTDIASNLANGPVMTTINDNDGTGNTHEELVQSDSTDKSGVTTFSAYDPSSGGVSTFTQSQINTTYSPLALSKK